MHSKYTPPDKAGLGQLERKILDHFSGLGKVVIHTKDLETELGYNRKQSSLILSRLSKKGWIQRLKAGIYHIVPLGSESANPTPEDSWAIAMEVFSPCYISGWTAAEYWDLTEQIFNPVVICTSKKQRNKEQTVSGILYRTRHVPSEAFFGIKKIWSSNKQVLIADVHRTIIDILNDPEIGAGGRHTLDIIKAYKELNMVDPNILLAYAEKLNNGAIIRRLGFVGEQILNFPNTILANIQTKVKSGIVKFDPNGPNTGPIISKWGIRINIPLRDIE